MILPSQIIYAQQEEPQFLNHLCHTKEYKQLLINQQIKGSI